MLFPAIVEHQQPCRCDALLRVGIELKPKLEHACTATDAALVSRSTVAYLI